MEAQNWDIIRIISIAIGIIGLLAGYYYYRKSKILKTLEVIPITNTSVIEVKESVPELKIFYKNDEIDQLYVHEFKIRNSGPRDIRGDDFIPTFNCSTGAKLVKAVRTQWKPESCDFDVDYYTPDQVFFKTSLFKSGAEITAKLTLLSQPSLDFANNQIVDGTINVAKPPKAYSYLAQIVAVFVAVLSLAVSSYFIASSPPARAIEFSCTDPLALLEKAYYQINCVMINVGREAISAEDFEGPIILKAGAPILDFTVRGGSYPVRISTRSDDIQTLVIEPFLINPAESVAFNLILKDAASVVISARIRGVWIGGE